MALKKSIETEINIMRIQNGRMDVHILGTSPIILRCMSAKTRAELLLPKGKKNAAEKASTMKHNPIEEYQESPYTNSDPAAPTFLELLPSMFKQGMMTAALDMPGTKRAQIGRLLYVEGDRVSLYGIPQIVMHGVRSADMNHTPDIRTRAIIGKWACKITISYIMPMLNETGVANLIAAAGITSGVGDWRVQKGSGNYGCYVTVDPDSEEFAAIVASGGRKIQESSMENPVPWDDETEKLLDWFGVESKRRGFKVV